MKRLSRGAFFLFFLVLSVVLIRFPAGAQLLRHEAGFTPIEPVSFSFQMGSSRQRLALRSSEARIWYSFHPADVDPEGAPILIFFNGGPGSATSCGLMSMYTNRYTLDNTIDSGGGDVYIPNPYPWTQLGNLLYIDARQSGFSYNLMDGVGDGAARFLEFNAQNFNPFFDAGDFIRLLLRFLAAHPSLRDNPVIIVGESYGGIRSTAILYLLLNYDDFRNGVETYQDPALAEEIEAHFQAVFPAYAGQVVPPEVIARQFGRQVLIQPALTMNYQEQVEYEMLRRPGSVVYEIGREVGTPYDPAVDPLEFVDSVGQRDLYIYTKPRGWLTGFFKNAARLLHNASNLALVTETDVMAISGLYAAARSRAYRIFDTDYDITLRPDAADASTRRLFLDPAREEAPMVQQEPGDMTAVFGTLQPWDRYFISSNGHANWAFYYFNVAIFRGFDANWRAPYLGRMFLKNVAHVRTFITNAAYDLVVYTRGLPEALALHADILESAVRGDGSAGEARPGEIILTYRASTFPDIPGLGTRTIRFPIYSKSCHAVSLTQPADLYDDVSRWLQDSGLEEKRRGQ